MSMDAFGSQALGQVTPSVVSSKETPRSNKCQVLLNLDRTPHWRNLSRYSIEV